MTSALSLQWSFGFDADVLDGVLSLCDGRRQAIFYPAAQTGVVYDYSTRTQKLLQGHCNPISCAVTSADKRWLVTADMGVDSLIVVWDSEGGAPVRTIFNPHPVGVLAMDISSDATFLAVLSASEVGQEGSQELSLWELANTDEHPALATFVPSAQQHTCVRFNTSDVREIMTNGQSQALFWSWGADFACYAPKISRRDFRQPLAAFTVSTFLPNTTQAVTGTSDGALILWDAPVMEGGAGRRGRSEERESLELSPTEKRACKVIRLCEGSVNHLSALRGLLVVAGEDGAVRVYDYLFRLEAWFEDLDAGAVTSVSFAAVEFNRGGGEGGGVVDDVSVLNLPPFVVATRNASVLALDSSLFTAVRPAQRRGTLLVQGMSDEVHGLALHPSRPLLVITCYSGHVYLWDYELKVLRACRVFDASKLKPHCACFDASEQWLCVGFAQGGVKILDAETLDDLAPNTASFKNGRDSITLLKFSADAEWLAAADASNGVQLWRLTVSSSSHHDDAHSPPPPSKPPPPTTTTNTTTTVARSWTYVGRYYAHSKRITGLEFGKRAESCVLVSVAEDRTLVEYDLSSSSVDRGVQIAGTFEIEETAKPTACLWHPSQCGDFEDRIITCNDEFKMRQWNADNKLCRRTSLGPTFGGPIARLEALGDERALGEKNLVSHTTTPSEEDSTKQQTKQQQQQQQVGFVVYASQERVLGLLKLPLDGNPNKTTGLIAHPREISALVATSDGRYVFTAGGADHTVNLWLARVELVTECERMGGRGVEPYLALLPSSSRSRVEHDDAHTTPYFANKNDHPDQDHLDVPSSSRLNTNDVGALCDTNAVYEEIVDYFYYLQLRRQGEETTQQRTVTGQIHISDVPSLMRAVGYYPSENQVANLLSEIRYADFTSSGEVHEWLDLEGFIKLFVNHKPIAQVDIDHITQALNTVQKHNAKQAPLDSTDWQHLKQCLLQAGEKFSEQELKACLHALQTDTNQLDSAEFVPNTILAHDILGFDQTPLDYNDPQPHEA